MREGNVTWGAPRVQAELELLGFKVSKATVAKYMKPTRKPPSQTWKTFLQNHAEEIAAIDFFVVPTATFQLLYGFLVLRHERREVVHFAVTGNPSAAWAARQLTEAFPWDEAPRYLLRDRDGIYGEEFTRRVKAMGIEEVLTAPRSPWQNPYAERLIGSVRRECLDHVVTINEHRLQRVLDSYVRYYNRTRTHLALAKDTPEGRTASTTAGGRVVSMPEVGGLHHRYERLAA